MQQMLVRVVKLRTLRGRDTPHPVPMGLNQALTPTLSRRKQELNENQIVGKSPKIRENEKAASKRRRPKTHRSRSWYLAGIAKAIRIVEKLLWVRPL